MRILSFGEVLFDIDKANNKKAVGGAPFNICAHLAKLGEKAYLLSAVGRDELGAEALLTAESIGMHARYIKETDFDTGVCLIEYENGEPSYELSSNTAYDNIFLEDSDKERIPKEEFDVFCFGTLAQRCKKSQKTLEYILNNVKFNTVFFDMNLRKNYYSKDVVEKGMNSCDILKINRFEYEYITNESVNENVKVNLANLCEKYNMRMIILTLDSDGAVLYSKEKNEFFHKKSDKCEKVVSAVGAGDGFSACFLKNYLNGVEEKVCLKRANLMGAYIIGFKEAVPEYDKNFVKEIMPSEEI